MLRAPLRALLTAAAGVASLAPVASGYVFSRTFLEDASGTPVRWHTASWSRDGAVPTSSWINSATAHNAAVSYAGIGTTHVTLGGDLVLTGAYQFDVSSGALVLQDGFIEGGAGASFSKLGGGVLVLDVVGLSPMAVNLGRGGILVGKSNALGSGLVTMQAGTMLGTMEGARVALGNEVSALGGVTLHVGAGGALSLGGVVRGSIGATVEKTGLGELSLSGGLSGFSGGMDVREGVLLLPGLMPSVGGPGGVPLVVRSGSVIGLDGDWSRWNASSFFEAGAGLRVGATGAPTSLRLSSLSVVDEASVSFDLSRASADVSVNDRVIVNGDFVLDADRSHLELNFSGLSLATTPGLRSYELFRYNGLGSSVSDAALARLQTELDGGLLGRERSTYTLRRSEGGASGPGVVTLDVSGNPFALAWTGAAGGVWSASGPQGTQDWLLTAGGGTPERFYDADTVTFGDTAAVGTTVAILGEVRPGSIVVNGALDYVFTADSSSGGAREANRISGTTGLVKRGPGQLTVLTRNDFTGAVEVSAGKLVVGDGILTADEVRLGGTGDITVRSGAELVYAINGDFSVTQRFTGGGTVVKNGNGRMAIGVDAAGGVFSGMNINLEINAGAVYVPCRPNGGNLLGASNTITINNGGMLVTEAQGSLGGVNLDCMIRINEGGVWTFTNRSASGISGGHEVNMSNLVLAGGAVGTSAVNNTLIFFGAGPLRVVGNAVSTINSGVRFSDGVLSATFDVETGSSLEVNGAFTPLSGMSLVKAGGGEMHFGGFVSGMSRVSVEAGQLRLGGGPLTTVSLNELHIADGARITTPGTLAVGNANPSAVSYVGSATPSAGWVDIGGNVTLYGGLSIGGRDTVETLTIGGNLVLEGGASKLYFTIDNTGAVPAVDRLNVNYLEPNGITKLAFSSVDGSFQQGQYVLVSSGAVIGGTTAYINQSIDDIILRADTKGGVAGTARVEVNPGNPNELILVIPGDSHRQIWRGTSAATKWNTADVNQNWYDNTISAQSDFWNGDVAVFTSDNAPMDLSYDVDIDAPVQPGRVLVEGIADYTFTTSNSGKISGRGGLTKSGDGTLRISSNAHDFAGAVEILGGVIEITTLANANTASALGRGENASKLVLNGGALRINNSAALTTNRAFTLGENGGTIELSSEAANTLVTFNGGSGSVAHTGTGNRTLTLNVLGGTNYVTATPTAGGVFQLQLTDPSSGKLKLVKDGAGFLILTGTNSHRGGTEISGGCLSIFGDRALGAVPTSFDPKNVILMRGGILFNAISPSGNNGWTNGAAITLDANRGIYLDEGGGTIRNGWTQDFTVKGAISGPGALTKIDTGLLILSGANTFSGGLVLSAGNLALQNSEAIPHGFGKSGVVLSAGQMRFSNGVDAHINSLTGTGQVTNSTTGATSTLYLGETGLSFTYDGVINNGAGTVALTKLGSGKLTLTGTNTFWGDVHVEGGVLRGATAAALGQANNYNVANGAALDLRGVRIDSTSRTIRISGEGVIGMDSDEPDTSFSGLSGALFNSSMASAASAAKVEINGLTRIATFADFALTNIAGTGDLTLAYLENNDGLLLARRKGFTIGGAGARVMLSPDAGTNIGRLNVNAKVTASMGTGTIVAPGGVNIGQDGNLQLNGFNIIQTSGVVTLSTTGTLTLMGDSRQGLAGFGNPGRFASSNASTLVTHNEAVGTGVLTVALYAGESYFGGRIGSTLAADATGMLNPLPNTGSLSLIVENGASGILTLANEKSDYSGATTIKGGVLNLEARLSVSDPDTGTITGVLGNSALTIDGGILRSSAAQLSSTTRTFTLGPNGATIESSGQGNLQFNRGNLAVILAAPGITNSLVLGGSHTGDNVFRLLLEGNLDLTKTGHGQWILGGAGDAPNTYAGRTRIENGTLTLGKNNALSASTGVTLGYNANAGGIGDTFGTLKLNGNNVTLLSLTTATNDAANRVINGKDDSLSELTLAIQSGGTDLFQGSLGNADPDTAQERDNAIAVIKAGDGTFVLGGAAAYSGDTQIVAGTLRMAGPAVALGVAGKNIFVGSPAPSTALFEVVGGTYDIDAGKTIVAGKSAAPSADLRGNFRLDAGTLFIGGEYDGGSRLDGTVSDSTGVLCTLTLDGDLSARSGVTSHLAYTFGPNPDLAVGLASDLLHVTGTLTLQGDLEIVAMPTAYRLGTGTYDIIQYGDFIGSLSFLKFNADERYVATFHNDTVRKFISMEVASALPDGNKLYWQGRPNTQWGDPTAATGANFYQALAPGQRTSYGDGDWAVFGDYDRPSGGTQISAANRVITIGSAGVRLGIAEFVFDGADYVLNGPGSIGDSLGGAGRIFKEGTGTLVINTANTYSGGTDLNAGTLLVGNDQALGTGTLTLKGGTLGATGGARTLANAVKVAGSSTIDLGASPLVLAGDLESVSADFTLAKTGSGMLTISGGGGAFTGTVAVNDGSLALAARDSQTSFHGAAFVLGGNTVLTAAFAGNGTVELGALSGSGSLQSITAGLKTFRIGGRASSPVVAETFSGVIRNGTDGSVAIEKTGVGTLILTGNNVYSGTTTITGGVLQIGTAGKTGGIGSGAITIGAAGTLRINGNSNDASIELAQSITSAGVFEKATGNTVVLLNDNAGLGGKVNIIDGTLQVGDRTDSGGLGTADIANNGILHFYRNSASHGSYAVTNDISGTGDILKHDLGRLIYLGDNTSTGDTVVNRGTLQIGSGAAGVQTYDSTRIRLLDTVLELNTGGTLSISGGVIGAGSVAKNGAGTAVITGTSAGGNVRYSINNGTLQIGNGGANGDLEGASQIAINSGSSRLLFSRSGTTTVSGRITSLSGGEFRVEGGAGGATGTVVLTASNEILGTIYVANHGILQLGDGGKTGVLNHTNTVTVNTDATSAFAFNRTGANLHTGSNIVIEGAGKFIKLGSNEVIFNSVANNTGGLLAQEGRLVVTPGNLPAQGALEASGSGVLVLQNGTTPWTGPGGAAFDWGRLGGSGTIVLGADATVGTGTYSEYNYAAATSGNSIGRLDLDPRTLLNLGDDPRTLLRAGDLYVQGGAQLVGQGTIGGNLHNTAGARIQPDGTSGGQLTVNGNFFNAGEIYVTVKRDPVSGTLLYDSIHYTGSARFDSGARVFVDISSLQDEVLPTGTEISFLVDDDTAGNPLGASVIGGVFSSNPTLTGHAFAYNNGSGVSLLFAESIRQIPGLHLHDGLDGYVRYLDDILAHSATEAATNPEPAQILGNLLGEPNPSVALNRSSGLGLASLTAMGITSAHDAMSTLRSHLESLRYERAINGSDVNAAPYIVGTGLVTRSGGGNSDPVFNANTYGGLAGVDHEFDPGLVLGMNAGYSRGQADILDDGGKVRTNTARLSVYGTCMMLGDWAYVDAQAFVGYVAGDVSRNTTVMGGRATAKSYGFDAGVSAYFGGILKLDDRVHFTPFAGFEFVHTRMGSFTESGSDSALRVDAFTQDSLRAKVGTGFNWVVPTNADFTLRVGFETAYAYELLDAEAEITARFARDNSGRKFTIQAAAIPEHTIQAGPFVELGLEANMSVRAAYSLEYAFGAQTSHHVNATFRWRF
ncbi:MAG: autotransporter-associated beta strand repeat-containing protein [Puniceicoccales bacterium]|nr:autotransporter-associated beta strand repeat-containing protein [Puniceicoccales bacterium]